MITLTRLQARCLRGVFRRNVLGLASRGAVPPLVFHCEGSQLRAQHRYAGLAVEHVLDTEIAATGVVALPLDTLTDVEGRDESPVTIEALASDRTLVRWSDRGIPQNREYEVPPLDKLAAFPDLPTTWSECPADLLDALAEASQTCAHDATRYALDSIQLRMVDGGHEVVATDGHQLLIRGGFRFHWADVLIKRSPIFACKSLVTDRPLTVGRTTTHIAIQLGPWTLLHEIRTGVRFPRVHESVPAAGSAATRLRLDAGDASFLGEALGRLPGGDALNSPATLDLNGRVAIRARGSDQERVTELVLAHSSYTGTPVMLSTNRAFLARAIRLGFHEVEIIDADSPLVLRDRERVFCFQPLSKESAIGPTDDVTRIESPSPGSRSAAKLVAKPRGESPVHDKSGPARAPSTIPSATNGPSATVEGSGPGGLAALINEAEALHEALSDAKARTGRLVIALRRHRKRERLVSTTLASLKALKLQDVAG